MIPALVDVGWPAVTTSFAARFLDYQGYVPNPQSYLNAVVLYAIFGIPLALVVCFAVGFPAWRFAETRARASKVDAMIVGAGTGLVVGVVGIALSFSLGLQTALDDQSSYNSWSWGRQIIRDGLPTLVGWVYWLADLAVTVLIGAAAGFTAWRTTRPSRHLAAG